MILYEPTFMLNRLVVQSKGRVVYNEAFHEGINIIRGDNTSGKSTIMDLIFYILGGDIAEWSKAAAKCDFVYSEITINTQKFTFKRQIVVDKEASIEIYSGPIDQALADSIGWQSYGTKRSALKLSFSQIFFQLLGLPESRKDENANLTAHQLLRLMYSDQTTSVDKLFRHQEFDRSDGREAIADYILGVDDLQIYALQIEQRALNSQYADVNAEFKAFASLLGKIDYETAFSEYESTVQKLSLKKQQLQQQIELVNSQSEVSAKDSVKNVKENDKSILSYRKQLSDFTEKLKLLELEIDDSKSFLHMLEQRMEALAASEEFKETLGLVDFQFCPSCLAPIESGAHNRGCSLCKRHENPEGIEQSRLRVKHELEFQLRESSSLLDKKETQVIDLKTEIKKIQSQLLRLERTRDAYHSETSQVRAIIEKLATEIGHTEKEIENIEEKKRLASAITTLIEKRAELEKKISKAESEIEIMKQSRNTRRDSVFTQLENLTLDILHRDTYEEAFRSAQEVEIDFSKDRVRVDGWSKFSASSKIILKNSLLFAIFQASLADPAIRLPRFLMIDNTEDKGMTPQRSQSFQKYIVEKIIPQNIRHQIIISTSMIAKDLDNTDLCVGKYYTVENKSLDLDV